MLPSWMRSRKERPRLVYFLAMEMTRRRLASTISVLALSPLRSHSRNSWCWISKSSAQRHCSSSKRRCDLPVVLGLGLLGRRSWISPVRGSSSCAGSSVWATPSANGGEILDGLLLEEKPVQHRRQLFTGLDKGLFAFPLLGLGQAGGGVGAKPLPDQGLGATHVFHQPGDALEILVAAPSCLSMMMRSKRSLEVLRRSIMSK